MFAIYVAVLTMFSFFYQNNVAAYLQNTSDLRLEFVQVIFRHGDRTPERPYGNDPNINETFSPYGWNSLDKVGRQNSYRLGLYLKNLYGDFINDYDPNEVTIWTTVSSRTQMCAQLVAAGLFPPKNLKWDVPGRSGNIWVPVTIDSTNNPMNYNALIHFWSYPCPAYYQLIHEQNNGPHFEWMVQSDPELVKAYEENTGSRDVYLIAEIYTTMSVEEHYGLVIPDWVKPFYPYRLKAFAEKAFYMMFRTDQMVRLREGAFLGHLIKQLDLKTRGSKTKFWLYSGHDLTVTGLGRALGIWKGIVADFNAAIIMELHSNSLGQHFVSIYFHDDTSKPPTRMSVPGCGILCPLYQFRKFFDRIILDNMTKECNDVDKYRYLKANVGDRAVFGRSALLKLKEAELFSPPVGRGD